jgi:hypothetical protein
MATGLGLSAERLPAYVSRFVGREHEITDLQVMLDAGRLVTISGVGGAGKTRLAVEVARRRLAGGAESPVAEVYWVPLAAVSDPAAVVDAAATHTQPACNAYVRPPWSEDAHPTRLQRVRTAAVV